MQLNSLIIQVRVLMIGVQTQENPLREIRRRKQNHVSLQAELLHAIWVSSHGIYYYRMVCVEMGQVRGRRRELPGACLKQEATRRVTNSFE